MCKSLKLSIVSLLVVAICAISAMAQSTVTGAIGGLVTNPNKEVVPGASVTVKNTGTNKEDTATTGDEGRFKVSNLQPGEYAVTITSSGFATYTQERVVVEVGRETTLDIPLTVQGVTGTVQVTAEAPVINTTQQDFSNNMNQTSINNLPINGQRWSNFALLTPGTTPDGNFGLISFRGISGLLNNSTVDGGDNNQAFFSEERGRTRINYVVSQNAVQEFQVNTSNYSSEYGRSAGGVTNAVTKSGTNALHGSGYLYDRNNTLGARNPLGTISTFNQAAGTVTLGPFKPVDRRYIFGGTVGGPIKKDKIFFFFNYDEVRRNFPGLAIFSSPSFLTTVNTTQLTGKGLTTSQINSALGFLNSETGPVPRQGNQRIILPKVDWNINGKNTLSATYNHFRWASPSGIQTQPTNTFGVTSFGDDFVNDDAVYLRLTSNISPTLVNEFHYNWSRDFEFENSKTPLAGEPLTAPAYGSFVAAGTRSPDIFISGGIEFGVATFLERPQYPDERRNQFSDTVTMTKGNHTIKFGGDFNHVSEIANNLRTYAGSYSYSNINDFIIDYLHFTTPSVGAVCSTTTRTAGKCYTSNYAQGFGGLTYTFATNSYNFFAQDQWRYTPRLTVNFGVRYEYQQLPSPILANPAVPQTGVFPSDKNNFGPRIGFAWDMTGNGKNSLRGGYGIYYGLLENSTLYNALIDTGVSGGQFQVSVAPTASTAPAFPNTLAAAPAGTSAMQFFQPNFQLPLIHSVDLIYEHEIAPNTVVSFSFLGSFGRNLPAFLDTNLNQPTTTLNYNIGVGQFAGQTLTVPYFQGARPNPNFAQMTSISSAVQSTYYAFVAQLTRRFTKGLQFDVNYTRSRATDNGQSSTTFSANNTPYNVFNLRADNGTSNFDLPNKLVADAVYRPHFNVSGGTSALVNGWEIAPIFQIYSGVPLNPTISGSAPSSTAGGVNGSGGATYFTLAGRNSFRLPKIVNLDLRLSRTFRFKESMSLELLAEAFNVFNRDQVTGENGGIYSISTSAASCALAVNGAVAAPCLISPSSPFQSVNAAGGTLFRERQIQGAIRFTF
jgi:outer membrane receptor protein involved in Fe transport